MDCKITSTKLPDRTVAGYSLFESIMAIGVGSFVMVTTCLFTMFSSKSLQGMSNYVDLERVSQNAIDRMTRDVRQTQYLVQGTTNNLTFCDADGKTLQYSYSPGTRTLTRSKEGTNDVLLTECDQLSFAIFQRNPIGGTYDQYPTATATNCKLINVSWVCSRQIFGSKVNTESVQTAKVVIRKQ